MKKQKKLIFSFLFLSLIFLLSACGIKSDQTLKVDKNFKGERNIRITFDSETLARVEGGANRVKDFIGKLKEKSITIKLIKDQKDLLEYDINMPFKDINEYISKARAFYKLGNIKDDIKVEFLVSKDNLFYDGIKFSDNIDVEKLFSFIIDKAIKDKLITEGDRNNVWSSSSYSFNYDGKEIISKHLNPPYVYDKANYIGPDIYLMTTNPSGEEGKWDRIFNVFVKKENIEKIKAKLKETLFKKNEVEELTPRDEKNSGNLEYTNFRFLAANKTTSELEKITGELFDMKSTISFNQLMDDRSFTEKFNIYEKLTAKDSDDNKNTHREYKIFSQYYKDVIDKDEAYYEDPNLINNHDETSKFKYKLIKSQELFSGYKDTMETPIELESLMIKTGVSVNGDLSRVLVFEKSNSINKKKIEDFLTKFLKNNNVEYEDKEDRLEVSYEGEKFGEINNLFFDSSPEVSVEKSNFLKFRLFYSEYANLQKPNVSKIETKIDLPRLSKIEDQNQNVDGNTISNKLRVSGFKLSGLIILVLGVLILLFLSIILIKKYKSKIKNLRLSSSNMRAEKSPENINYQDKDLYGFDDDFM